MLRRLDPTIRPVSFRVELRLDPSRKDYSGVVEIDVNFAQAAERFELHAQGLSFDKVVLIDGPDQIPASASGDDGKSLAWFDFGRALGPGTLTFSFSYRARFAVGLEGAYRSRSGRRSAVFTQFEAIGARRVLPCFDEPGFKAPFEILIIAPSWAQVIANSLETESASEGEFTRHRFAPTPPLPAYLVAFAVGDFDIVEHAPVAVGTLERAPIPLRGIARQGRGGELAYVLSITERLVLVAEGYFGIAYPFDKLDIIAVPDFASGGMENAGAITYDEAYVLLDEDEIDLDRKRDMLTLHAHELTHHWFGNLVTPQWWDDLWLNESFATLLEAKFSNILEPRWQFGTDILANAHGAMVLDLLPSVRRVHEPVDSEDRISTAFDSITYEKGSVVLAMVEHVMGEDVFRNFIASLLRSRKFGTYDTAGFVRELENFPKGAEAAKLLLSLIDHTGLPTINKPELVFPDDDVPRYQRVRLAPAQWLEFCSKASQLALPRALAVAIGFDVSFYAQDIPLSVYLSGIRFLAGHPIWAVAGISLENLEFILLELPEDRHTREVAAECFSPLFVQASSSIDMVVQWQTEKREMDLADFFAATGCNDEIHQQLMSDGLRLLKEDDPFESSYRLAQLESALLAAGRSGEDWVFARLQALLDTADDVHHRSQLISALCACPGSMVDSELEIMLQGEAFRGQEIPHVLDSRARFPEFREQLWAIVARNSEMLLGRLDGDMDVAIIAVADEFTTPELAQAVEEHVTPLLGRLRGGVPQLALTLDRIRHNSGLLARLRQDARK